MGIKQYVLEKPMNSKYIKQSIFKWGKIKYNTLKLWDSAKAVLRGKFW